MARKKVQWTRRIPQLPGWYWRVEKGCRPLVVAIERSESPDRDPIICAQVFGEDVENLHGTLEEVDGYRWSRRPIEAPELPEWAEEQGDD